MTHLLAFLSGVLVATTISVFAWDDGESRYGQLKNFELRNGITDYPDYEQQNRKYIPKSRSQEPC